MSRVSEAMRRAGKDVAEPGATPASRGHAICGRRGWRRLSGARARA